MCPLPTLKTPSYTCIVPSRGKSCTFRPFTIKEEKTILTMLNEAKAEVSDDSVVKNLSVQQKEKVTFHLLKTMIAIIDECVISLPASMQICDLTQSDMEYLLIQIRGKSVDEVARPFIACKECEVNNPVEVPLETLKLSSPNDGLAMCKIPDENITIEFQPIPVIKTVEFSDRQIPIHYGNGFLLYLACGIKGIHEGDEVHRLTEFTEDEIIAWVEKLPKRVIEAFKKYSADQSHAYIDISFECKKCKTLNELRLTDIQSFFH